MRGLEAAVGTRACSTSTESTYAISVTGTPACRNRYSIIKVCNIACQPQISRSGLVVPSWQSSMDTNCHQLLKPWAFRSALCPPTAASNPVREIRRNICEKTLHPNFKVEPPSDL